MIGVEALLRWQRPRPRARPPRRLHPRRRGDGPDRRRSATGCSRASAAQTGDWRAHGLQPNVGFNVSPRQLRRPDFGARLAERVAAHGIDPARLVLELTESAWRCAASRIAARARASCARRASRSRSTTSAPATRRCARLRELPVQILKIDRSFLRGVPEDPQGAAIVSAIIAAGRRAAAATSSPRASSGPSSALPRRPRLPARAGLPLLPAAPRAGGHRASLASVAADRRR